MVAPPARRVSAHSETVAPVVRMSSTTTTCRPVTDSGRRSRKAFRTFARRAGDSSAVWDAVADLFEG